MANCGIERLHPQLVLLGELRPLSWVRVKTIALAEEARLEVAEEVIRNRLDALVKSRELWNLRLSNRSKLPHGAGLRGHWADAESCCYRIDRRPSDAAVRDSDGHRRRVEHRRILVVRILVGRERVLVAARSIACHNPQVAEAISNLSDWVGRESRQPAWVTDSDVGTGVVQACQRNDSRLSPHAVLKILVLLPLNLRETSPLCVRDENIFANFNDSERLRDLSRTRVVRSARFQPTEVENVRRVILLVRVDEERWDVDAVELEVERRTFGTACQHRGHRVVRSGQCHCFVCTTCGQCWCKVSHRSRHIYERLHGIATVSH